MARIERWMSEGAQWQTYRSFIAPARRALPVIEGARRSASLRDAIDAFIAARLQ